MVRFGLVQNSPIETLLKTIMYRLYATFVTINLSYFIFGIQSVILLLSFGVADIISGLLTYYTYEHLWITVNSFKPTQAVSNRPPPRFEPSFPTEQPVNHHTF
jgi:uncharacterized membrane protein